MYSGGICPFVGSEVGGITKRCPSFLEVSACFWLFNFIWVNFHWFVPACQKSFLFVQEGIGHSGSWAWVVFRTHFVFTQFQTKDIVQNTYLENSTKFAPNAFVVRGIVLQDSSFDILVAPWLLFNWFYFECHKTRVHSSFPIACACIFNASSRMISKTPATSFFTWVTKADLLSEKNVVSKSVFLVKMSIMTRASFWHL